MLDWEQKTNTQIALTFLYSHKCICLDIFLTVFKHIYVGQFGPLTSENELF